MCVRVRMLERPTVGAQYAYVCTYPAPMSHASIGAPPHREYTLAHTCRRPAPPSRIVPPVCVGRARARACALSDSDSRLSGGGEAPTVYKSPQTCHRQFSFSERFQRHTHAIRTRAAPPKNGRVIANFTRVRHHCGHPASEETSPSPSQIRNNTRTRPNVLGYFVCTCECVSVCVFARLTDRNQIVRNMSFKLVCTIFV